jgi:Zn-dependent protease
LGHEATGTDGFVIGVSVKADQRRHGVILLPLLDYRRRHAGASKPPVGAFDGQRHLLDLRRPPGPPTVNDMHSTYAAETGVRPSPIFFAIVAITAVAAWATTASALGATGQRIAVFALVLGGWVVSLIFHEFAHAYLAWTGGDRSIAQRGYLTLDPRTYTNPLLSFGLPLLFIVMGGLAFPGGAVLINRAALTGARASLVALAGPLVNLAFGVGSLGLLAAGVLDPEESVLGAALAFFGFMQIAVFVLNMLPIPGFDGFAVLEPALPAEARRTLAPVAAWGPLIAILAIWQVEAANDAFFGLISFITGAFGVDTADWFAGYSLFRFWS